MQLMSKITVASVTSILTLSSAMAEVDQPIAVPVAQTADLSYAFGDSQDLQIQAMTQQEMDETQGAVAPVYALGVFMANTGRFIVTRSPVSRSVAVNAARNGNNVMVKGTSQQAGNLARQAYGKNNVIRHGPSDHKRSHVDYSHYQSRKVGDKGHIFYGNRYPR